MAYGFDEGKNKVTIRGVDEAVFSGKSTIEKIEEVEENIETNYLNMNKIAVISGNVQIESGNGTGTISLPDGFTEDNCVVISLGLAYMMGYWSYIQAFGEISYGITFFEGQLQFTIKNIGEGSIISGSYPYRIVLLKIS